VNGIVLFRLGPRRKGCAAIERDLSLRGPARHDEETRNYKGVGYRDLFISASLVDSIATVADVNEKSDLMPSRESSLFIENPNERAPNNNTTTTT